jgi:hypothetical protein
VAGRVSEGREAWICALCVGSVAATKSAKDKGFSKVLMWAKVGRNELCQRGGSFGVSDERRDFEVGAIQMRAVWRAELRGGARDASFCGEEGGMPEPRSLWGELWFF